MAGTLSSHSHSFQYGRRDPVRSELASRMMYVSMWATLLNTRLPATSSSQRFSGNTLCDYSRCWLHI